MGVVIDNEIWEPSKTIYIFLFISGFFSIFFLPSKTAGNNVFDYASSYTFLRFQRNFFLLFSISSVMEGLGAVFGEYELVYHGFGKEQMLMLLCVRLMGSLLIGSFLGILSDLIGHKKLCLAFYVMYLLVSFLKGIIGTPVIWSSTLCLSLASSIFSFSFEAWMVIEIEKIGQRQDSSNGMLWLMTFFESTSFIGSQFLGNYLINGDVYRNMTSIWKTVFVLAVVAIFFATRGGKEAPRPSSFKNFSISVHQSILCDKKILLLSWAQTCTHFAIITFWILWAPIIVADGREVSLGLIYPCLMGSRMLGSTGFPWFLLGTSSRRIEEYIMYTFVTMAGVLSFIAYDYQEIGVLVMLFCLFHACLGMILPSLAQLRTIYVPCEVRGGMISLSLIPSNAALLIFLVLRGYSPSISNSTIIAFSALGLFSAGCSMHVLRKWGKQSHQNRQKL